MVSDVFDFHTLMHIHTRWRWFEMRFLDAAATTHRVARAATLAEVVTADPDANKFEQFAKSHAHRCRFATLGDFYSRHILVLGEEEHGLRPILSLDTLPPHQAS